VVDAIPVLASSARAGGSADFFNQRWLDYTGLSAEQARDWGWTVALHSDDLNGLVDYWRSVVASGKPGEIEGRLRRFDGVYRSALGCHSHNRLADIMAIQHSDECFRHSLQTVYDFLAIRDATFRDPAPNGDLA
jgi:PAS domain-containing protein